MFHLECHVTSHKTGEQRHEGVYEVTSLGPDWADPECLLCCVREHWQSEHKGHGVGDVTFDEERSQMRWGRMRQVMAALRHTAIGLRRRAGETNIVATCRRIAAQPWAALALSLERKHPRQLNGPGP